MPSTVTYDDVPITVGTLSTPVLPANSNRKYALFVNVSDEVIFLKIGENKSAAVNEGIPVGPTRGAFEMSPHFGNLSQQAVVGVCASGGKLMLVTEAE